MRFDLDATIADAVASSGLRFPRRGDPVAAKLERELRRQSADRQLADAAERRRRGAMRVAGQPDGGPGLVLPPGVRP